MTRDEIARQAQERIIKVFEAKPAAGKATNIGTARVTDGLKATFEQDGHSAILDMPEAMGGTDAGPSPGFFGRAAVAGCVAIGLKMTALREGVQFDTVEVEIAQDFDNRGIFGLGDVSAASTGTTIAIRIDSPATRDTVQAVIDRTLAADPWFLAYRDAQAVTTHLVLNGTG